MVSSDEISRRGLQNKKQINGKPLKLNDSVLKFDNAYKRKNVNELSTAMSTKTPRANLTAFWTGELVFQN